jgi:hypothetical protein
MSRFKNNNTAQSCVCMCQTSRFFFIKFEFVFGRGDWGSDWQMEDHLPAL